MNGTFFFVDDGTPLCVVLEGFVHAMLVDDDLLLSVSSDDPKKCGRWKFSLNLMWSSNIIEDYYELDSIVVGCVFF